MNTIPLSERMKEYEAVFNHTVPRKSYIIIRIDGKAFRTYTKGMKAPFDNEFVEDMNQTAAYLCKNIQNAKFGFVQSDEISILIHEEGIDSMSWYGNTIQKMVSIAASMATSKFNHLRALRLIKWDEDYGYQTEDTIERMKLAQFDARVFILPNAAEVHNYFVWRQQDGKRNSISAVAQALFSDRELHSKNSLQKIEMIKTRGKDWNEYDAGLKIGRFVEKFYYFNDERGQFFINDKEEQFYVTKDGSKPLTDEVKVRSAWEAYGAPVFQEDMEFLMERIKY